MAVLTVEQREETEVSTSGKGLAEMMVEVWVAMKVTLKELRRAEKLVDTLAYL